MTIAEYRENVSHHELQAAHAEEERRLLQGQLWSFVKFVNKVLHRDGGVTEIPEFYFRYDRETKAHRRPEHFFGIIRQSTRTTK